MIDQEFPNTAYEQDVDVVEKEELLRDLILYNDEVNTFDFVIKSLVEVCEHDVLQAEQCTVIVHYNGKCVVKSGEYDKLDPMRHALIDRGLSAVIK
jgi:ATP-dependent Clp protease adaptor protein ClpS